MAYKNFNLRNVVAIAICLTVIALAGCSKTNDPKANNPNGNNQVGGGLTITGMPSVSSAYDLEIYSSTATLNSITDRMLAMNGMLAYGGVPSSGASVTFSLYQGPGFTLPKTPWTGSGTNLKVILSKSTLPSDFVDPVIATNVNITNGVGTVSYSDFSPFGN